MVRPVQQAAGSGEVKTWRGGDVVEAGAEAILNTLAETGLLIYPGGWKSDKIVASQSRGHLSRQPIGDLRRLLRRMKVLSHMMLLLVRGAEV